MNRLSRSTIVVLFSMVLVLAAFLSACSPAAQPSAESEAPPDTSETESEAQPEASESESESQPEASESQSTDDTPTKLVVASFYPVDQVSGWDGMVAEFKDTHPNVEIEVQVTPFDQYQPKLLTQIVAGDAPDVAGVENGPFPLFVDKNMLTDLTSYMDNTEGFSSGDFFPHLLDRYTYDGKVYGIPYDAQPYAMLFFNPKLFDDAGVSYPTKDTTWPELAEMAKQLSKYDDGGAITDYGILGGSENAFIYAFDGRYVDDLRNPTTCMLDQPEAQAGLQFWLDMMYEDQVTLTPAIQESLGGSSNVDLFTAGKAAMLFGGFWNAVENPEGMQAIDTRLVMAPTGPDGNRLYPTGGTAYTILQGSDNPELAWEFIQFFMGRVGTEQAYESSTLGAIYPPANVEAFDWYLDQATEFVDTIQADKEALEYIIFSPYALNWAEINSKCVTPTMDLITRNDVSVEDGTAEICGCVNKALAAE